MEINCFSFITYAIRRRLLCTSDNAVHKLSGLPTKAHPLLSMQHPYSGEESSLENASFQKKCCGG